ncbi:hypothetical protein ACJX0J_021879, partial [Zea mays]
DLTVHVCNANESLRWQPTFSISATFVLVYAPILSIPLGLGFPWWAASDLTYVPYPSGMSHVDFAFVMIIFCMQAAYFLILYSLSKILYCICDGYIFICFVYIFFTSILFLLLEFVPVL